MNHVYALSADIGTRPSGTFAETAAAEYLRGQLESFGYSVSLQEFPVEGVTDVVGLVTLGDGTDVPARPFNGTISGHGEGPLVSAGAGQPGDFPAVVAGGVALVARGTVPFGDIVQNAADAGAIAVIIYNSEPGLYRGELPNGGLIPAVSVSQESGNQLLALLGSGSVTTSVSIQSTITSGVARNVIATAAEGDCRVIIGGHYDSVPDGPGANDNASGTAVALEIARALAADGLDSGLCVILFGGEERGLLGSIHYVANLTEDQRGLIAGFLNFDMLGVGDGWPIIGTAALVQLASEYAAAIGITTEPSDLPDNVGSDHAPFVDAGIPAILYNCFCDPNYHTILDRVEFIKPERLQQAGEMGLPLVKQLLGQ